MRMIFWMMPQWNNWGLSVNSVRGLKWWHWRYMHDVKRKRTVWRRLPFTISRLLSLTPTASVVPVRPAVMSVVVTMVLAMSRTVTLAITAVMPILAVYVAICLPVSAICTWEAMLMLAASPAIGAIGCTSTFAALAIAATTFDAPFRPALLVGPGVYCRSTNYGQNQYAGQ